MTIEQQSEIQVVPMDAALGAEIRGLDIASSMTSQVLDVVNAAWSERLVLVFRNQRLSDDDLLAFSRLFGELDSCPWRISGLP